ncbi:MAG: hypothetical protein IJN18_05780 [Clostridia bacterium]|nr:hypothetical protein [Clostridia bacterium]
MKRFFEDRRSVLCLLLFVTILLCNTVQIRLDIREHQRLTAQFAVIPHLQEGTVWCTDEGDILLISQDGSLYVHSRHENLEGSELVMIDAGYFDFRKAETRPVESYLGGQYFMDDEMTLRLEPYQKEHPILEGRPRLILKRYFIADDNCPFYHINLEP